MKVVLEVTVDVSPITYPSLNKPESNIAAIEAIMNALSRAEEAGFTHRHEDKVSLHIENIRFAPTR